MTLYLASTSPRRRALLRMAGLSYKTARPKYVERASAASAPQALVRRHAMGKALSAAKAVRRGVVLGADTVVRFQGRTIGKPVSLAEAERVLLSLQSRWHEVYTGVALLAVRNGRVVSRESWVKKTRVRLAALDRAEVRRYFRRINPLDKAGAYAIQSRASIVAEVRGSFTNAVGLPMEGLASRLRKLNLIINK